MILTPAEMQAAEEAAFARGANAEDLMEKAGLGIADAVSRFFPRPRNLRAYLGKGHNAGDVLVAARHLKARGWGIDLRDVAPPDEAAPLTQRKRREFLTAPGQALLATTQLPVVLLDGLLGIGAQGPLRAGFREMAREINEARRRLSATTFAIDVPSGLDGETGRPYDDCVEADITLTVAFAKSGLIADEAARFVGRLELIPLPEIEAPERTRGRGAEVLTDAWVRSRLSPRPPDLYKNQAGRVAVIAGSRGLTGAAALTSEAAVAAGAGLVSLHVPETIYEILAARVIPEVMVHPLPENPSTEDLEALPADAFAVGPGLGAQAAEGLLAWLQHESRPMVLDADALNLLARHPGALPVTAGAGPRLLTPHPGEFKRLFPEAESLATRRRRAEWVIERLPSALLYKGSRTLIAAREQPLAYNTTGNAGMASGGMGDVLTGVAAGWLAQGKSPYEAGCMAAWLCGRAAEIAVSHGGESQQSLRATHVLAFLGGAVRDAIGLT